MVNEAMVLTADGFNREDKKLFSDLLINCLFEYCQAAHDFKKQLSIKKES